MRRLGLAVILLPIIICGFCGLSLILIRSSAENADFFLVQSRNILQQAGVEKNTALLKSELLLMEALRDNPFHAPLWHNLSDVYEEQERYRKTPEKGDFIPETEITRIIKQLSPHKHKENQRKEYE